MYQKSHVRSPWRPGFRILLRRASPLFLPLLLCFFGGFLRCASALQWKVVQQAFPLLPQNLRIFCKGRQAFQPSRENTMMHHQQQPHRERTGYQEKKWAKPSKKELLICNQGACCNSICTLTSNTLHQQVYTLNIDTPGPLNVALHHSPMIECYYFIFSSTHTVNWLECSLYSLRPKNPVKM